MLYVSSTADATASIPVITGHSIAKRHWRSQQRAGLAAKWVLERLRVKPTIALASTVFHVDPRLTRRAIRNLTDAKAKPSIPTAFSPTEFLHRLRDAETLNSIVEQLFREQQPRYYGGIALPVLKSRGRDDLCIELGPSARISAGWGRVRCRNPRRCSR